MLHPSQFQVNDAWIFFKLSDAPIVTDADGDFNLFALMDAASCFILSSTLVSVTLLEPSKMEAKRLLKEAQAHKHRLPRQLFIASDQVAKVFILELKRQGIAVVPVSSDQLQPFVGEAQDSFKDRFGGKRTH